MSRRVGGPEPPDLPLPTIDALLAQDDVDPAGLTAPEMLLYWRERQGFYLHDAAPLFGVDPASLCGWEQGHHAPHPIRRGRIAEIVGIPVEAWGKGDARRAEARRDPSAPRGARMLMWWRLRAGRPAWELADDLGVTDTLLSAWQNGRMVPGLANRRKLREVAGIAEEDWDPPVLGGPGNPSAGPSGPDRLRRWRESRGLRVKQAAQIVGVHPLVWARWERGAVPPNRASRERIHAHTGIPTTAWPPLPKARTPPERQSAAALALAEWRRTTGKKVGAAARAIGVSSSTWSQWEHLGRRPALHRRARIERVTGVPAALWEQGPTRRLPRGTVPSRGAVEMGVWRGALGLDEAAAARLLDVRPRTWVVLERGYQRPGTDLRLALASLTGIPTDAWDRPPEAERDREDGSGD